MYKKGKQAQEWNAMKNEHEQTHQICSEEVLYWVLAIIM